MFCPKFLKLDLDFKQEADERRAVTIWPVCRGEEDSGCPEGWLSKAACICNTTSRWTIYRRQRRLRHLGEMLLARRAKDPGFDTNWFLFKVAMRRWTSIRYHAQRMFSGSMGRSHVGTLSGTLRFHSEHGVSCARMSNCLKGVYEKNSPMKA